MAKHDRITVHTRGNGVFELVARKSGGSLGFEAPAGDEFLRVVEYDARKPPTVLRVLRVHEDEVVAITDSRAGDPDPHRPAAQGGKP